MAKVRSRARTQDIYRAFIRLGLTWQLAIMVTIGVSSCFTCASTSCSRRGLHRCGQLPLLIAAMLARYHLIRFLLGLKRAQARVCEIRSDSSYLPLAKSGMGPVHQGETTAG